jgi:hypothetical protein
MGGESYGHVNMFESMSLPQMECMWDSLKRLKERETEQIKRMSRG